MDSTNFQPDHHHQQQQHYLHQQHPQLLPQPQYPYFSGAFSSLLDDNHNHHHHLGYGVSSPPHHHHRHQPNSSLLSQNQGEVPSASSGVTSSDTSSFSYHSLSSNNNNNNDDVMANPSFLSNFLGIINQTPNDGNYNLGNPWLPQVSPARSINNNNNNNNNSFSNILSSGGGTSAAANALGQLGLTSSSPSSCFLGLNLQASDFLNGGGRLFSGYGDHHALAPAGKELPGGANLSWPSRSRALESNKASAALVNNGVTGTKRPAGGNCSDTSSKVSSATNSNKKTSLKTSCPPFKVRKEKLGDRIAALHQMVSPFGKTDTASVLTEAIGYVQFLQDQIHTLCMPNVKPLRNKPCNRLMQPISSEDHQQESKEGGGGAQDLRKRGLCLVPLSWTSFITADQLDASLTLPHHYF